MKVPGREMILYAAYATLIYILLFFIEITAMSFFTAIYLLPLYILELLFTIIVYAGWMQVGKSFKNVLLFDVSVVALVLVPVSGIVNIYFTLSGYFPVLVTITSSIMMGAIVLVFGISLLKLKKQLGRLAQITAVLDIIGGICLISVFLLSVYFIMMPVVLVIEAMLLFKAYYKSGKKKITGRLGFLDKIMKPFLS